MTPALLVYAEIDSVCSILCALRIRLPGLLAECLGAFLGPDDHIQLRNYALPPGTSPMDLQELQLGAHLQQRVNVSPTQQLPDDDNLVTLLITRLRLTEGNSVFEAAYSQADTKLYIISAPPWTTELPPPRVLKGVPNGRRIWDTVFPSLAPAETTARYPYTPLALLQATTDAYFYGVIVDVAKTVRPLTLARFGRLAAMNVDVVDASVVSTFRASLLAGSPVKVSVLLLAPDPQHMPFVASGDILRVHRSKVSPRQDLKSGAVFLDANNTPGRTSIHIWSLDALTASATEETGSDNVLTAPLTCQWQSQVPRAAAAAESPNTPCWVETGKPLSQYDWDMLCRLGRWAADSLYHCRCFTNVYLSSLWRLQEAEPGTYVDVVVKILGIENEPEISRIPELFNSQQDCNDTQASSVITSFVAAGGRGRMPPHPDYTPSQKFRVSVNDPSVSQDDPMWIVSNFPTYVVPHVQHHFRAGDWIRIRNVAHAGVKRLGRPSHFLLEGQSEAEFWLLDAYKSRITKVPHIASETR